MASAAPPPGPAAVIQPGKREARQAPLPPLHLSAAPGGRSIRKAELPDPSLGGRAPSRLRSPPNPARLSLQPQQLTRRARPPGGSRREDDRSEGDSAPLPGSSAEPGRPLGWPRMLRRCSAPRARLALPPCPVRNQPGVRRLAFRPRKAARGQRLDRPAGHFPAESAEHRRLPRPRLYGGRRRAPGCPAPRPDPRGRRSRELGGASHVVAGRLRDG